MAILQDGVITGTLRVQAELPICKPHERVKPIDGANRTRQTERDPIASPDMLEFVREGASQVGFAPRPRGWGKDNRGPHDATGHRTDYRLVHHDVDGSAESFVTRKIVRDGLPITPWKTLTADAANLPQPQHDRYETTDHSSQPYGRQQRECGTNGPDAATGSGLRRPCRHKHQGVNSSIERSGACRVCCRRRQESDRNSDRRHDCSCRWKQREHGKGSREYKMTDRGSPAPRQPARDHRQRGHDGRLRNQRQGDRPAGRNHASRQ